MQNVTPTVVFYANTHTYWHNGKKIKSGIQSEYIPDFDREYWLTSSTLKKIDLDLFKSVKEDFKLDKNKPKASVFFTEVMSRLTPDQHKLFYDLRPKLQEEWAYNSAVGLYYGSKFHDAMERASLERGYEVNPWDGKKYETFVKPVRIGDNYSICDNLYDLPDGFYPELLVFWLPLMIGGQADKVFIETIGSDRFIDIDDYKTGKKPKTFSTDNCLDPLGHLNASNHTKYNLQISGYAWMLEQHGFIPRKLAYTYVKDYDKNKQERTDLDYLKNEITTITDLL